MLHVAPLPTAQPSGQAITQVVVLLLPYQVRFIKLMQEEYGLPRIKAAHSIEQWTHSVCLDQATPAQISLSEALPMCLDLITDDGSNMTARQLQLLKQAGLWDETWDQRSGTVLNWMVRQATYTRRQDKWLV